MISSLIYLLSAFLIVISIDCMSSPYRAVRGYYISAVAMGLALITCIATNINYNAHLITAALLAGGGIGIWFALRVELSALPQMVALLNGIGGLSSSLLMWCVATHSHINFIIVLCFVIGLITFSGSMVAFAKLHGWMHRNLSWTKWLSLILFVLLCFVTWFYIENDGAGFHALVTIVLLLGICLTMPIGGADMPVVISLLNSFSGWAVVLVGLLSGDLLLIITGTLVGTSGTILSYIMSKAMNRPLLKIIWPKKIQKKQEDNTDGIAKKGSPEEAAFIMSNARKIIIVPGFGMAAAHAQQALKSMTDILSKKYGVDVKYAIHPVAGRMPGHMNVLLAEAQVPYENVYSMADINSEFASADVAYVIGANDVTNPVAKTEVNSPLYGMPILDVEKAKTIFFVKRSLGTGYSGVDNPLFYAPNTIMLLGDAKTITEEIVKDME
ncbi:MAG: NAD(P)(+) transhydrogenase (Re/Si-specific) subunit beta [Pseudomonadota bacterium]|nr:NAD(P)(+) transhydrogenase (Re/Si-specific) subunit beta [Pseudomonadota bacterium]